MGLFFQFLSPPLWKSKRLINGRYHLLRRQFIEALAVAVEPPLAAFELAWQGSAPARHCRAAGSSPRPPMPHSARRPAIGPKAAGGQNH
jgi:hypothetical protein